MSTKLMKQLERHLPTKEVPQQDIKLEYQNQRAILQEVAEIGNSLALNRYLELPLVYFTRYDVVHLTQYLLDREFEIIPNPYGNHFIEQEENPMDLKEFYYFLAEQLQLTSVKGLSACFLQELVVRGRDIRDIQIASHKDNLANLMQGTTTIYDLSKFIHKENPHVQ